MHLFKLTAGSIACLLAGGCATSFTTPAAVRVAGGAMLIGSTTASLDGGHFSVTDGAKLTCGGTYDPKDNSPTLQATFACNDGRTGIVDITRNPGGLGGTGVVVLSDGTRGFAAFGSNAAETIMSTPLQQSR